MVSSKVHGSSEDLDTQTDLVKKPKSSSCYTTHYTSTLAGRRSSPKKPHGAGARGRCPAPSGGASRHRRCRAQRLPGRDAGRPGGLIRQRDHYAAGKEKDLQEVVARLLEGWSLLFVLAAGQDCLETISNLIQGISTKWSSLSLQTLTMGQGRY